jgi:diguanylate cyclase (GGDEF)-like protein
MSTKVLCTGPDTPAGELIALMHEHNYSCIVISENDLPVGIVTERDIVAVLDQVFRGERDREVPVSEFMSSPVQTILEDRPIFEAIVFCRSRNVRHLPVVDRSGHLAGLLTQSDLTAYHLRMIEEERVRLEDPFAVAGDLIAANERLKALAHEDALLGIGNRRAMEVDLQYTHEASLRYTTPYAVALCDVDHFKLYNDAYGHHAGDDLLKQIVDFLHGEVRKSDRMYRYGGDELLLLLPMTTLDSAIGTFERLLDNLVGMQIEHPGNPAGVLTLSCGISAMHPKRRRILNWKQIFDEADHALYQVKRAGRNGVSAFKGRKLQPRGADSAPYGNAAASRF